MSIPRIIAKFLIWRIRHIPDKHFVLILSCLVGFIGGLAAVVLKWLVHNIYFLLTGSHVIKFHNYYYVAFPFVGLVLTYLLAKFLFKDKLGHGVSSVLYCISKGSSIIRRRLMISRMVTSAVTVGFGGSVGLEAPIVVTGSAIGSNIGRIMHLNYKKRSLMIGCGAAASVAAIFNSPIAGVIFTIEVILSEININKFIPLLIASVTGSLTSQLLLGDDILFHFHQIDAFTADEVPFYIGLGVLCGLIAVYFTRMHYLVENAVGSIKKDGHRLLTGGLLLGLIVFVFPPMYGEGYSVIKHLLGQNSEALIENSLFNGTTDSTFLIAFVVGMIIVKAIASALTIGSGGSGGIFAPSLFIGALSGFLYTKLVEALGISDELSPTNFTLVGMCGVMSGVLHAPLTGIFLIAEITDGYGLMVPLMIVSAISYSTISYFEPHSIYTKHLVEAGDLILQGNRDKQVLSLLDMKKLIEKDFKTVHPDATLGELIQIVKISKRNVFPVVNSECNLVGIVKLDDIRNIMFEKDKYSKVIVKTIMKVPKTIISTNDDMPTVMGKFEKSGSWNLPVIHDDVYVGFFSKSKIFNAYRQKLIRQGKEE